MTARSDSEVLQAFNSGVPLPADEWTTLRASLDNSLAETEPKRIWISSPVDVSLVSDKSSGRLVTDYLLNGGTLDQHTRSSSDGSVWSEWAAVSVDGTLSSPANSRIQIRYMFTGGAQISNATLTFSDEPVIQTERVLEQWDSKGDWEKVGTTFLRSAASEPGQIVAGPPVSATFTRNSTAYKQDASQVSAGVARFENGSTGFGQGIMVERGTSNRLSNPQFESGLAGWTKEDAGGTVESVTSERYFGVGSLHLRRTSDTGACYAIQDVTASAGAVYSLSGFVKRVAGSTAASLYLDFLDSNKNRLAVYWVNAPLGDWTRLRIENKEAPANTRYIRVWLYLSVAAGSAGTEAYYDGILLEASDHSTTFHDSNRAAECLEVPANGVINPAQGTIEMRINATSCTQVGQHYLFASATSGTVGPGGWYPNCIAARLDPSGIVFVSSNGNGDSSTSSYSTTLSEGPHDLAFSWGASELKIYVDGVRVGSGGANPRLPESLASDLFIGSWISAGNQIDTTVEDIRLSSTQRSDSEIQSGHSLGASLPVDENTTLKLSFDNTASETGPVWHEWCSNVVDISSAPDQGSGHLVTDCVLNGGDLVQQTRSSEDGVTWSDWFDVAPDGLVGSPAGNRIQVRYRFSGDGVQIHSSALKFSDGLRFGRKQVYQQWDTKSDWERAGAVFERSAANAYGHLTVDAISAGFTRDSTAYRADGSQVGSNTPRYEVAASGYGQGVLVEGSTTNLLTNPQFESDLTGWNVGSSGGTVEVTTDDKFMGAKSLHLRRSKDYGDCYVTQEVSASPGTVYSLSAFARKVSGLLSAELYLEFLNGNNRLAIHWDGASIGDWTRLKIENKTAPANTTKIRVWLYTSHGAGGSATDAYFDGVLLETKTGCTSFHDSTRAAERHTVPTFGALFASQGTVEMRVDVRPSTQRVLRYLFSTATSSSAGPGGWYPNSISARMDSSGIALKTSNADGDASQRFYAVTLSEGEHNLAFSWGSSHLKVYVDGVLVGSGGDDPYLPSSLAPELFIGSWLSPSLHLDSTIEDFRLSCVQRSDAEIQAGHASGAALPVDENTTMKLEFDGDLSITGEPWRAWTSNIVDVSSATDKSSGSLSTDYVLNGGTLVQKTRSSDDGSTWSDWTAVLADGFLTSPPRSKVQVKYEFRGANVQINNGALTYRGDATTITKKMEFDSKNNLIKLIDGNNKVTDARYDASSNLLSTLNPERKEVDGITYDAYGNPVQITPPGGATVSPLSNGSFERVSGSLPEGWTKGGSATVQVDSAYALHGQSSLKISSASTTDTYLYQSVSASAGQLLTLSADMRFEGIPSQGSGGAEIGLEFRGSGGSLVGYSYGNCHWGTATVRTNVCAVAPDGTASVLVVVRLYNASGTVWFDGVQLEAPAKPEEGFVQSGFNSVENAGFEQSWNRWTSGFSSGAGSISLDSSTKWAGASSAKITASSAGLGRIYQRVPVYSGEKFTLAGVMKTDNVLGADGAKIYADFYNSSDGYLGSVSTRTLTGTHDFTRQAVVADAPSGAAYCYVVLALAQATGTVYFDNVQLIPKNTLTVEYDSAGNYRTAIVDPEGHRTQYTYDAVGNRTRIRTPRTNEISFTYDATRRLRSLTDPSGHTAYYDYDEDNNLTAFRDSRSAGSGDNTYRTSFAYTPLNQLSSVTDPLSRTTQYEYDNTGNLTSVTYPNGRQITFTYDDANRTLQKRLNHESRKLTYTYDGASNVTRVVDSVEGTYTFKYDRANRLTTVNAPATKGGTVSVQWDAADNIVQITNGDYGVNYSYGSGNQVVSVTAKNGGTAYYNYDEQGRLFQVHSGDGTHRSIDYYPDGRLRRITDPGNPGGWDFYYYYDGNGNIVNSQAEDGWDTFAYDNRDWLTHWWDKDGVRHDYAYDAAGNLTQKDGVTYTHNAANQVTNAGFAYDDNGNLVSDGTFDYTYDSENRLVRVDKVSDGSQVAEYKYDYQGLRIEKTTASGTIKFTWDPFGRLIEERDGSGNMMRRYYWDTGNRLVAIWKSSGTLFPHINGRGDIMSLTDSSGNRVVTYRYDPWGKVLAATGSEYDQPVRYAGYYWDAETGLYYLKGRYYSPMTGRFIQTDPTSPVPDYLYARNNPVKNLDPDGLDDVGWVNWFSQHGGPTAESCSETSSSETLSGESVWPVPDSHEVTSPFGLREDPLGQGGAKPHNGIDIVAPPGSDIVSTFDGVVVDAGPAQGYGNWIRTRSKHKGDEVFTIYGHMKAETIRVKVGQSVKRGTKIAEVGSEGRSTGPHLHFEIRIRNVPVDPMQFFQ